MTKKLTICNKHITQIHEFKKFIVPPIPDKLLGESAENWNICALANVTFQLIFSFSIDKDANLLTIY